MKIKVSIAEDNPFLAHSMEEKLGFFEDIQHKFTASNGKDLLKMLEKDHNIDVVLMDIQMPEMDGIEATGMVRKKYPHIKVIMVTVFEDEERIFHSIMAGANGYLLKDESPDSIYNGIKDILNGGAPMSPKIAAKTLALMRNPDLASFQEKEFELTSRETEILEHLSKGLSYQRVADNLFISSGTVRKHIENIYRKLEVHNKVEAIEIAKKHKII